jgi:uncharacterized protein YihD (DUF1040 family)
MEQQNMERRLEQRETIYTVAALWQRWHQQRFMQVLGNLAFDTSLIELSDRELHERALGHLQQDSRPSSAATEGRNPDRIPQIIEQVRQLWEANPDISLNKLLSDAVAESGWQSASLWEVEDTDEDHEAFLGSDVQGQSLQSLLTRKLGRGRMTEGIQFN